MSRIDPRRENGRLSCRTPCAHAWRIHEDLPALRRLRQSGRRIVSLDGARGGPSGKPFVAAPGFNINVVNRSAPDLFPATVWLKCSVRETKPRGAAPLAGGGIGPGFGAAEEGRKIPIAAVSKSACFWRMSCRSCPITGRHSKTSFRSCLYTFLIGRRLGPRTEV